MKRDDAVAQILADWIEAQESGEAEGFETLVERHPELEPDLRRGMAAMALVDFALDRDVVPDEHVPERLGQYRILGVLGDGGMGTVYKAEAEFDTDAVPRFRTVALKRVHQHLLQTPGFYERFRQEAEIGRRIRHENVVRTYGTDSGDEGGTCRHLLVMEYVEGQTLSDLLVELERVPEELCRHIGVEIARGLQAIHEAGVVHRDLKPENVLITKEHEVKVMDLGAAWFADAQVRLSQTGVFLGSLLYAAPEQYQGGDIDGRADLYALGMLLYVLATGGHPFQADEPAELMRRQLEVEARRAGQVNPQLSPFFEELVHALMSKSPEDRFRSAADVLDTLRDGEESPWWQKRARALRVQTARPLRRIRIPRETAIYGRDDDLARLRVLYGQVKSGDGRVVLIEGEAGIGKTRLVDEFVAGLLQEGEDINFLFGSYAPGGSASATGAFSTAYRDYFGAEALEETLADHLALTPSLVPGFVGLLRGASAGGNAQSLSRDSLQTVFVHATRSLAAERPTIVLIDDLHFAPEEGRAIFSSLAMAVPGHSILLIGTMRPGVPEAWTTNVSRFDHTQQTSLLRLGAKDLALLLGDAFHSEQLAHELGIQIALKSDGNPFFIFEIIRGLREGHFITKRPDGTWVTTQVIQDIQVPSSVTDMVEARLADLHEEERELLDVASCCGFEFDPEMVASAVGMARLPALKRFGRIEQMHRLVRSAGRCYRFDHHQIQETVYASLHEQIREEYHAAIGAAIEARAESSGRTASSLDGMLCVELCEHFLRGARGEKARPHLDAALSQLESGFRNDRAIALADRALEVPGLFDGGDRLDLLLRKATRLDLLGRRDVQERTLAEARALAETADNMSSLAKIEHALGTLRLRTGCLDEAKEYYERSLVLSRDVGDGQREARTMGGLGVVLQLQGRLGAAHALFERFLDLARATRDRRGEGVALGSLGNLLVALGRYGEARLHLDRRLTLAVEVGDREAEVAAANAMGTVIKAQGRHDEALGHFQSSLALAREIGARQAEVKAAGNLGVCLQFGGRYEQARAHYEKTLALAREIGDQVSEAWITGNLGNLSEAQGFSEDARTQYEKYRAMSCATGHQLGAAYATGMLGNLYQACGSYSEARQRLDEFFARSRELGDQHLVNMAHLCLGALSEAEGGQAEAESHFDKALMGHRSIGARSAEAGTLVQRAKLLIWSGRLDAAKADLDAALVLAREFALPGIELLASAYEARLQGGDIAAALASLARHEKCADYRIAMEARYLLWRTTSDHEHLTEARRRLDHLVEHAPEEYRESMLKNVRLHREILEAWEANQ